MGLPVMGSQGRAPGWPKRAGEGRRRTPEGRALHGGRQPRPPSAQGGHRAGGPRGSLSRSGTLGRVGTQGPVLRTGQDSRMPEIGPSGWGWRTAGSNPRLRPHRTTISVGTTGRSQPLIATTASRRKARRRTPSEARESHVRAVGRFGPPTWADDLAENGSSPGRRGVRSRVPSRSTVAAHQGRSGTDAARANPDRKVSSTDSGTTGERSGFLRMYRRENGRGRPGITSQERCESS